MNAHHDEDEYGDVYVDEGDVIQEITVDDEDLPEADDEVASDIDGDEADDSIHTFTGHTGHKDSISAVAFSADGQFLASGSLDGLVQVWDTYSGNLKCKLEGPGEGIEATPWTCTLSIPKTGIKIKAFIASVHASADSQNLVEPSLMKGHPYHTEGLTCMAITSDSTVAITGSKDGSVHMVNIKTGKVINSLAAHTDSVECIGLSPSRPWAATGGMDGKLIIWDLQHSSPRGTCNHDEGVSCLLWLGTTNNLVTGCVDGKVRVWDCHSGTCLRTFRGHAGPIQAVAVSIGGEYLVSVSIDGTARVFEIAEFR
ncbi:hypothetical protein QJS10_CPB18g00179 [Acorus calamus]|uniref:Angio-associated migratory cell protein n=1 Tax=Acorus calamus TaxID=4465 RepID=A0AAV9CLI1_ACOCL|nr:hypothetical protein QJS10_CPB18g00179 [Acorus calamus]